MKFSWLFQLILVLMVMVVINSQTRISKLQERVTAIEKRITTP